MSRVVDYGSSSRWLRSGPAMQPQHAGGMFRRLPSAAASKPPSSRQRKAPCVIVRAEKREYYDVKDMPPMPFMEIARIHVPALGYTVFDKSCEAFRRASLAIFCDIHQDDQYNCKLNRKSAITALCMYDREDVEAAQQSPGDYPNIDLLYKVYNEGLEYEFVVEEVTR